jgi:uncharacterized protein (TIGR02996 family)
MHAHPDADAFVRAILRDPADLTTRLVFADWLEETGQPANVAWARFIRLGAEIAEHVIRGTWRVGVEKEAERHATTIHAKLAIPASALIAHPDTIQQFLPLSQLTVTLAGHRIPQTVLGYVPESVARDNFVLPLQLCRNLLFIAMADTSDQKTIQKLEFILNKNIAPVQADQTEIEAAIRAQYGQREQEVGEVHFYEMTEGTGSAWSLHEAENIGPVEQLVDQCFQEVLGMGSWRLQIRPEANEVGVQYRIQTEWGLRGYFPQQLLTSIFAWVARNTGIVSAWSGAGIARGEFRFNYHGHVYKIRATIEQSPHGPAIDLDLLDHFMPPS